MQYSRRSNGHKSRSNSQNSRYSSSNSRDSFRRRGGNGGGGRRGHNQATFDPTHVIMRDAQVGFQNQAMAQPEKPTHQFSDFQIAPQLKQNIANHGYTTPTPIQDQIIPHILEGKDVVGIANTGTGKTAAFLIPLLHLVIEQPQQRVLIIAPTRELALQIRDELMAFSDKLQVYSTVCIGGAPIGRQLKSLSYHPQFVIGTPGRIKDLNQRGKLNFNQFSAIVLDEVDRMLDMGFVHEMRAIINALPENRQSLFFSATMTDRVKEIMRGFLRNPVTISVKTQEMSANVKQEIVKMKGRSKLDVLHELLSTEGFEKVLVFGRTKHGAERLSRDLRDRGLEAMAIHGNKSQGQRQRTLRDFREDKCRILIATDVVSRGLDVDNITHVINFDLPESYEDYIHRIGRTGRANNQGVALTFVD